MAESVGKLIVFFSSYIAGLPHRRRDGEAEGWRDGQDDDALQRDEPSGAGAPQDFRELSV